MILLLLFTYFIGKGLDHTGEKIKGLLVGLELIEGLMAVIFIPFFANHPKLYLTDEDIRGEE